MVSAKEQPYTDTTEPSNTTTLCSDIDLETNTACNKIHSQTSFGRVNAFNENEDRDCKCHGVHPNFCVPKKAEAMPENLEQLSKENALKPPSKIMQFETSTSCLCRTSAYTLPVKRLKGDYRITFDMSICLKYTFLDDLRSKPFWCRFNWKWPQEESLPERNKTYKLKLRECKCSHYAKPFMCCEISEGIPNEQKDDIGKATLPKYESKPKEREKQTIEKIDIYYFDHGNSAYYRTTDSPPILATEKCAEKTDQAATRFWAEIFGTIHIGTAFVTAFILQFLRFILFSIVRPLTVGILQLLGDYLIKPLLSIVFNALIQPIIILFYNIATSLRDLCEPLAEAVGLFLREIANLCRGIRIVEIKHTNAAPNTCT